jgi:hypothetical protein
VAQKAGNLRHRTGEVSLGLRAVDRHADAIGDRIERSLKRIANPLNDMADSLVRAGRGNERGVSGRREASDGLGPLSLGALPSG